MKVDISKYIEKQSNIVWSQKDAVDFALHLVKVLGDSFIEYDKGVPETWIRLVRGNETISYIHVRKKIIFIEKEACKLLLKDHVFLIENFRDEVVIDKSLFKNVFNREFPSEYGYDDISINDLAAFTATC